MLRGRMFDSTPWVWAVSNCPRLWNRCFTRLPWKRPCSFSCCSWYTHSWRAHSGELTTMLEVWLLWDCHAGGTTCWHLNQQPYWAPSLQSSSPQSASTHQPDVSESLRIISACSHWVRSWVSQAGVPDIVEETCCLYEFWSMGSERAMHGCFA